ncbi:MAG: hypothetical protein B7Z30_13485, partial [Rhizobiales bacterium 12-68-15]
ALFLSRPDSRTLLVIGTGHVAFHAAEAHCAVRPVSRVLVHGRSPDRTQAFMDRLAARLGPGVMVSFAPDIPAAAAQADIITCGTTATRPLICGADVRPGTHVDLIGAFTPQMRESDDALIAHSAVYVDTRAGALRGMPTCCAATCMTCAPAMWRGAARRRRSPCSSRWARPSRISRRPGW